MISTVSALPYTLFTISAGAVADMVDRKKHLLESERMTKKEKDVLLNLRTLRIDPNSSEQWVYLSVEKEVLNKRVRAGGLPSGYIDQ
jgi:hypothetical protein